MLSHRRRIDRTLFERVMKGGRSYATPLFAFKTFTDKNTKDSKFSFVISRKIAKSAITRNKFRRRGYNIIQELYQEIKPGVVGIFFLKAGVKSASPEELKREIKNILEKSSAT